MNPEFVDTSLRRRDDWAVVLLRASKGTFTPAMCAQMRRHTSARHVVLSTNRTKVFVLTPASNYAPMGPARQEFIDALNNACAATA